jgi:hypothetical protein
VLLAVAYKLLGEWVAEADAPAGASAGEGAAPR